MIRNKIVVASFNSLHGSSRQKLVRMYLNSEVSEVDETDEIDILLTENQPYF